MSRVTVTNPYDLLGDENEERTNVPAPKKEQKAAPVAKPAPKVAAKPAATSAVKPAAAKPAAKTAAPKADGAKAPKPANTQAVRPPRDSNTNLQERDKESRPPRDKRDHRQAPAGDKKRPFDRKSGTGRSATENKKGGQGKGNWGGEVDAKEGVEALKEKEEKTETETEENKEEKVTVEGEAKEEKVEEPVKEERTLEEYLANKKPKAPVVAALQPRTVNADDFNAAGLVPLQRGESGDAPLNPKKKAEKTVVAAKESKETKDEAPKINAADFITFASHQDEKRRESRNFRNNDRNSDRQGGERRPPRNNNPNPRAPRDNKGPAAAQAPALGDFPSLKA